MTRANPFKTRLRTERVTIRLRPDELAEIREAAERKHRSRYSFGHVVIGRYIRLRTLDAARAENKEANQVKSDNALERNVSQSRGRRNVSQSSTPARTNVSQRSRSDNPPRGPR